MYEKLFSKEVGILEICIEYIVDNFSDDVFRAAFSLTKNRQESEDIVSDVFMKFFEVYKEKEFKDEDHIKAWLIRAAINRAKDYLKSFRYKNSLNELKDEYQSEFNFSDANIDVKEAMNRIDEKYRIVLYLYYFQQYSTEEIAKLLGTVKGTIVSRLSRAREKLKLELPDYQ